MTVLTGKTAQDGSDTLTGGLGIDTFNVIATDNITTITDLGNGGSDILVIASTSAGASAIVTNNYTASESTANNKSTAGAVLNANNGVDINMENASGEFGYVINGGEEASTLQEASYDSITGNVHSDKLIGNRGNDTINGGGGADIINTGRGSGFVQNAGVGADTIIHDEGNSCYSKLGS